MRSSCLESRRSYVKKNRYLDQDPVKVGQIIVDVIEAVIFTRSKRGCHKVAKYDVRYELAVKNHDLYGIEERKLEAWLQKAREKGYITFQSKTGWSVTRRGELLKLVFSSNLQDASEILAMADLTIRQTKVDGKHVIVTRDYKTNRVNVETHNGIVVGVEGIG
jgi:hypothetical protein